MLVTDWVTHTVCAQSRLTWRDVPHLFSAQPEAQTCRLWSWWLQRGWPGPDRPPRWPHWTASERKTAAVNCQTPAHSASGSASTATPSLDEQRERERSGGVKIMQIGCVVVVYSRHLSLIVLGSTIQHPLNGMTYDDVTSRESLWISAESEITQLEMITQTDKSAFKNMPGFSRQNETEGLYPNMCMSLLHYMQKDVNWAECLNTLYLWQNRHI